jgi:hypothetical protein
MPKPSNENQGDFEREVILCINEASHEISINCCKGLMWESTRKPLYHVSYMVCGDCARSLVEVKLDAKLRKRP